MDGINNQENKKTEFKNLHASYDLVHQIEHNNLLSQIFSYAPVGLLVIDQQKNLYKTNKYIFNYFNRKEYTISSEKFGNCFQCVQVNGANKICGEQRACQDCIMRKCLVDVLEGGQTIPYTEFSSVFSIDGEWMRKYFTVSAVPIDDQQQRYALVTLVDITEQKNLEQKLKNEVITDSLTNVFNRRYMVEYIEKMLEAENDEISIAIIDIDNFKKVNDNFGHLVGDQVLKHLARILKEKVGTDGMVARYGGEEFVILLKGMELSEAMERLGVIRQELVENLVPEYNQPIRFSGGLMHFNNRDNSSQQCDQILKQCDDLLYRAKQQGKDRVLFED